MFICLPARQTVQLARVMHHSNGFSVMPGLACKISERLRYGHARGVARPRNPRHAALRLSFLSKKISDRALLGRRFECVNEFPEPLGENFRTKLPIMSDSGRSNIMAKKPS